jgi:hypothetical protein
VEVEIIIRNATLIALILSASGLIGTFWQNFYSNRLRVTEKTDQVIERFRNDVTSEFNIYEDKVYESYQVTEKEFRKLGKVVETEDLKQLQYLASTEHILDLNEILIKFDTLAMTMNSRYVFRRQISNGIYKTYQRIQMYKELDQKNLENEYPNLDKLSRWINKYN